MFSFAFAVHFMLRIKFPPPKSLIISSFTILMEYVWRLMEPLLWHIHRMICPLETDHKLSNMSIRIHDTTYFTVFFTENSGIKSCHLFLLENQAGSPSIEPSWLFMNFIW